MCDSWKLLGYFYCNGDALSYISVGEATISLAPNTTPNYSKSWRYPHAPKQQIKEETDEGVAKISYTTCASPALIEAKKKDTLIRIQTIDK